MTDVLLLNAGVLLGAAFLLWLASLPLRDASIVDRFWGTYFVLVAASTLLYSDRNTYTLILFALATIWGLRLSLYLTWRNWGGGEDFRYQKMRRYWGARFPIVSLFSVFLLQAGLAWIVSLSLQAGISRADDVVFSSLVYAGFLVWLTGLVFECVGDWQLARFKADPANSDQVMDQGLWRYTRHPNYFGDAVVWWGRVLVGVGIAEAWWTSAGPLAMTYLLMRVSGVPMLERNLKKSRPGYEAYVARTSAFVPRPPKNPTTSS